MVEIALKIVDDKTGSGLDDSIVPPLPTLCRKTWFKTFTTFKKNLFLCTWGKYELYLSELSMLRCLPMDMAQVQGISPLLSNKRRQIVAELESMNRQISLLELCIYICWYYFCNWWWILLRVKPYVLLVVVFFFFFSPSSKWDGSLKCPGWNAAIVHKCIFSVAGAVLGIQIFRLWYGALMLCQGLGLKWREVHTVVLLPALGRAFIIYLNLWARSLKLEARPGSCFVACGSVWRVHFWKAAEGGWTSNPCAGKSSIWN